MKTTNRIFIAGILSVCASATIQAATNWIKADKSHIIVVPPADAVTSGHDSKGNSLFVCRGTINTPGLFPGWSIVPSDGCHIGSFSAGAEVVANNFDFLVTTWEHAFGGAIPANPVQGGFQASTRPGVPPAPLYYCRLKSGSAWLLGKIGAGSSYCSAVFVGTGSIDVPNGQSLSSADYEVLVKQSPALPLSTVHASLSTVPADAIAAGKEGGTGKPLYLCAASYNGLQPGAFQPGKGCLISYNGQGLVFPTFDVLTVNWQASNQFSQQPPKFEFPAGVDAHGEALYLCRGSDSAGGIRPGLIGKYLAPCQIGFNGYVRYPSVLDLLTGPGQPVVSSGLP
jgi:hypothetical protein